MSATNKKKWQKEHFKTNTKRNDLFTHKHTSHMTKAAGIEVLYDPKKWERSHGNKWFS